MSVRMSDLTELLQIERVPRGRERCFWIHDNPLRFSETTNVPQRPVPHCGPIVCNAPVNIVSMPQSETGKSRVW